MGGNNKSIGSRHKSVITYLLVCIAFPLLISVFIGFIMGLNPFDSFGRAFISGFSGTAPYAFLCMHIGYYAAIVKERKKHSLLRFSLISTCFVMVIVTSLAVSIAPFVPFLQRIPEYHAEAVSFFEKVPVDRNQWGLEFFQTASSEGYENARKYFNKAIFWEKYIVIWNDNEELPTYYFNLAQSEYNLGQYEKASQHYNESLKQFKTHDPENSATISVAHERLAILYAYSGENDKLLEHSLVAIKMLNDIGLAESYRQSVQYILAANAYRNELDFQSALECFKIGLPMLYDNISWGLGDSNDAMMLTVAYKAASLTAVELGDKELCDDYLKEYNDMIWLRNFSDNDVSDFADKYHWSILP